MEEKTTGSRCGFAGRLLTVDVVDVQLPDGRTSVREIVRHPGAVVILPQRPDGRFVFVRQYRKAVEAALVEAVAGTLDPGENPARCARRELLEETGHRAENLLPLGELVPAPGYTSERLHAFHASVDADPRPQATEEDENIECVLATEEDVERWIDSGDLVDAKTLAIWMLWLRKRRTLR